MMRVVDLLFESVYTSMFLFLIVYGFFSFVDTQTWSFVFKPILDTHQVIGMAAMILTGCMAVKCVLSFAQSLLDRDNRKEIQGILKSTYISANRKAI